MVVGQALTLKTTVSVMAPGVGTPTGSVTFYDGATAIGTVPLSGDKASLPMTYTSPGSHSFTAVYWATPTTIPRPQRPRPSR